MWGAIRDGDGTSQCSTGTIWRTHSLVLLMVLDMSLRLLYLSMWSGGSWKKSNGLEWDVQQQQWKLRLQPSYLKKPMFILPVRMAHIAKRFAILKNSVEETPHLNRHKNQSDELAAIATTSSDNPQVICLLSNRIKQNNRNHWFLDTGCRNSCVI